MKMLIGTALVAAMALAGMPAFADNTGAAGSTTKATDEGSSATLIAGGIGGLALIGAIVAGSTDNGTTSTTSSTSTH